MICPHCNYEFNIHDEEDSQLLVEILSDANFNTVYKCRCPNCGETFLEFPWKISEK